MSRLWMWRSANDRRGPLCTAQLSDLLRSRPGDEVAEVQVSGAADWISASAFGDVFTEERNSPADDAAEAVAQLLTTAEQLRTAGQSDLAVERRQDRDNQSAGRNWHVQRTRVAITTLLLVVLGALLLAMRSASPPSNAAALEELQRLHRAVVKLRSSRVSATDAAATPNPVVIAVRQLAEQLEFAAESVPLLSLESTNTKAGDMLARRELLFAARDLARLAEASAPLPVVEAEFQRHMELAAAYLEP